MTPLPLASLTILEGVNNDIGPSNSCWVIESIIFRNLLILLMLSFSLFLLRRLVPAPGIMLIKELSDPSFKMLANWLYRSLSEKCPS